MSILQEHPDLLDYVNAKLRTRCGSFLELFLNACLRADGENFDLLRPILEQFAQKYPADRERLKMERIDRGAE